MSVDPARTSLLELGATGVLDGEPFTLVGRRVIRGRRGSVWNEWTLDGIPHATLAESAGRFTLYREAPLLTSLDALRAGERVPWVVVERGTGTCVAQFGTVPAGLTSWDYADLSEVPSGRRATISGDTTFLGVSVDPSTLGLAIRREPPALVPTPNVAMPSGVHLWLEVGDVGTLEGVTWHVVGAVSRESDSRWEEYCVYAPGRGLSWLVESDGHWSFVEPLEAGSVVAPPAASEAQTPRVVWATGELPWAVEIGESVTSIEHGDLVLEHGIDDITWSRQAPLATDDVARAFKKRALPKPR